MTDGLTFINSQLSGRVSRGAGYQAESVREVKARAGVARQDSSSEELRGLRRLNQALDQNEPLRDDVPRGYYLNINI